jgi:hypothetical protein
MKAHSVRRLKHQFLYHPDRILYPLSVPGSAERASGSGLVGQTLDHADANEIREMRTAGHRSLGVPPADLPSEADS